MKLLAEKVYHIYSEGRCLHANLAEDAFNRLWEYYHDEQVAVKYEYEACEVDKDMIGKSSY